MRTPDGFKVKSERPRKVIPPESPWKMTQSPCRQRRQRVRVEAEKQRPADALAVPVHADGLADRGDVRVIEAAVEGYAAVPGSAERHALCAVRRIRAFTVIRSDQACDIDERSGRCRFAGERRYAGARGPAQFFAAIRRQGPPGFYECPCSVLLQGRCQQVHVDSRQRELLQYLPGIAPVARGFDGAGAHHHQARRLGLQMVPGVEVGHRGGVPARIQHNLLRHGIGAQLAQAGGQSGGNHGVLRAVFGVDFAGEAHAPSAPHARPAAVVRHAVAQHRNVERMPALAQRGRFQDFVFAIGRERRHRQAAAARRVERIGRHVAGYAHLPLGFFVERFQVVVNDRPIVQRASRRASVEGLHAEVLRHVPPGQQYDGSSRR